MTFRYSTQGHDLVMDLVVLSTSAPLLLPSPAPLCSHVSTSALPELPLGHLPLLTPIWLHCPCLQHTEHSLGPLPPWHVRIPEWEIAKETLYLFEKKAWQILEIFGETPL